MFFVKLSILVLLVLDELILVTWSKKIHLYQLLRLFRAILPIFYDNFLRKSFSALLFSYKDIIVYLIFYSIVIFSFAVIGNQIIQIDETTFDYYSENYG